MTLPRRLGPRSLALAGAVAFLASFAVYAATHAASLYLDDSGETATVAVLLGVGHPPGYPFHTLLARLAVLSGLGAPCVSVNLLSALLAAGTVLLLFVALARRSEHEDLAWLAALTAALGLGLGPVFWHNALGAKGSIYHLNNLLSAALLACSLFGGRRAWRAFWLLLGLAMAHHYMSQLPLLPAYVWLWRTRDPAQRPWRESALAVPGLALILYLPLRSAQDPGLNWGALQGLGDLWFYWLRLQYASSELTRSAGTSLAQAWHALGLTLREGHGVLLPLALFAAWRRRGEAWVQALGAAWLASLASVTLYLNLGPERLDLMRPYLFPAYLCQMLLGGLGAWQALQWLQARLRPWALLAGLLGLALPLALQWATLDLSRYHFALDNARGVLAGLPERSLLLAQGDAVVFPLWYLQRVEGRRRDVAVVGLPVLPMAWVREDLGKAHPDLRHPVVQGPIGAESVPALTQSYLRLNRHRPQYAIFNRFDGDAGGWQLAAEGPQYRVVPPGAAVRVDRARGLKHLALSSLRGFWQRPLDPRTLTLVIGDRAINENGLGLAAEEAGAWADAVASYRRAGALHPENPDYPFNQGNALYGQGRKQEAIAAFEKAVALDPGYVNGWYNLGVTRYQVGEAEAARSAFQRVLALDPTRSDVKALAGQ